MGERIPGAELLPLVTPGFTDSHWVREACGTAAYGFAPVFEMDLAAYPAGVHGADESLAWRTSARWPSSTCTRCGASPAG